MASNSIPQYLAIGHICADLQPDGSTRLGGSALFAAYTAHKLGLRAAVVTACADDLDLSPLPAELQVVRQPARQSTMFENRYGPDGRTQLLHARAPQIDLDALPSGWQHAPIIHLAPIIQEVPHTALDLINTVTGATPQGWLRSVQPDHLVVTHPPRLLDIPWSARHIAVMSEEDIEGDEQLVWQLSERIDLVVLTRAERGATLWQDGTPHDVPAFPASVVDPTGAGDVFAAAFFAALCHDRAPLDAVRWACAAAAFSVEGPGIAMLPTAAQVEWRAANGA